MAYQTVDTIGKVISLTGTPLPPPTSSGSSTGIILVGLGLLGAILFGSKKK